MFNSGNVPELKIVVILRRCGIYACPALPLYPHVCCWRLGSSVQLFLFYNSLLKICLKAGCFNFLRKNKTTPCFEDLLKLPTKIIKHEFKNSSTANAIFMFLYLMSFVTNVLFWPSKWFTAKFCKYYDNVFTNLTMNLWCHTDTNILLC